MSRCWIHAVRRVHGHRRLAGLLEVLLLIALGRRLRRHGRSIRRLGLFERAERGSDGRHLREPDRLYLLPIGSVLQRSAVGLHVRGERRHPRRFGGRYEPGDGVLPLSGDTGISAGMESALLAIVGKPRIVPLYSQVSGQGSNTTYSIVQFVGVRVLEVDLREGLNSSKRLILQPANVVIPGAIRATVVDPINPSPEEQRSQFVYSPVWLIR